MNRKSRMMVSVWLLLGSIVCSGYEIDTHELLSERAVDDSIVTTRISEIGQDYSKVDGEDYAICDSVPGLPLTKSVKEWIAKKRKVKLHFTPTYSSWLNQIEIWFNILSKDVLKGAIWKSTEQMASQIIEYIKTYNRTRAKPFNWTYSGNPLVF